MNLKIFVAGHNGLVGSSIVRYLKNKGNKVIIKDRSKLNLLNQSKVEKFFKKNKIDQIYIAAAKVGGIYANKKYPADFIYENITITSNLIHSAYLYGVKKILFIGSSAIYPKNINRKLKENDLLTGLLDETNVSYSISKIACIKMCEAYNKQYNLDCRVVVPCNLYGPNDKFFSINSHVVPSLVHKFHLAKIKKKNAILIQGNKFDTRDFLYVDDFAAACYRIMNFTKNIYLKKIQPGTFHINVSSGIETSIYQLCKILKKIIGYDGQVNFEKSNKKYFKKKSLNDNFIKKIGWKTNVKLSKGLSNAYINYLNECKKNKNNF
jgi:GDP-L-fucose synthase